MAFSIEPMPLALLTVVWLAKWYYILFAVLTLVGGIMGFVKARSAISLIAGGVSGALLVVASYMLPHRPIVAYTIGVTVSILLAGKFIPDYLHKKALVPAGLMSLLSIAGIVITLLAWYGK